MNSVDFTYKSDVKGSEHVIDHLVVTDNFFQRVCAYQSLHEIDNFSDHCPAFFLTLNLDIVEPASASASQCIPPKLSWVKANDEQISGYQVHARDLLGQIES